jgi:hypothetical protein
LAVVVASSATRPMRKYIVFGLIRIAYPGKSEAWLDYIHLH